MSLILQGAGDPQLFGRGVFMLAARITHDVPAGTYQIPIPAGCVPLTGMSGSVVTEAFNATSPTLTIGDGSDADGYADNTDVALATAATATTPAIKLFSGLGQPYANGKRYAEDDTIDLAWNPGTDGTTGSIDVFIACVNLKNLGIPGGVASTARIP